MSRRLIAVTALVVAAAALTACSGSSTPASTDGEGAAGSDFGLVKDGTLTVATEGTYRPFSFHDDGGSGDLTGYDVEIIQAVADELGRSSSRRPSGTRSSRASMPAAST